MKKEKFYHVGQRIKLKSGMKCILCISCGHKFSAVQLINLRTGLGATGSYEVDDTHRITFEKMMFICCGNFKLIKGKKRRKK